MLKLSKAIEIIDAVYTYHLNIETILKKLPQAAEVVLDAPILEKLTLTQIGEQAALAQKSVDLFNQYFFDGPIEILEGKLEHKLKLLAARLPKKWDTSLITTDEETFKVSLEGVSGYNFLTETFKLSLGEARGKGPELKKVFSKLHLSEIFNTKTISEHLFKSKEFNEEEAANTASKLKEILLNHKMVMVSYDIEGSHLEPWHTLTALKNDTSSLEIDGLKVLVCTAFEALMILSLNSEHERELIIESTFLLEPSDSDLIIETALKLMKSGGVYSGALHAFNAARALS